jgi:hypothetical protein
MWQNTIDHDDVPEATLSGHQPRRTAGIRAPDGAGRGLVDWSKASIQRTRAFIDCLKALMGAWNALLRQIKGCEGEPG